MTATVTQLPVRKPQPAPSPPSEASEVAAFISLLCGAAFADGERSVYARLGIPQPPPSPSAEEYLTATGVAAILSASRPS